MKTFKVTYYDYWNPRERIQVSVKAKNSANAYGIVTQDVSRTSIGTASVIVTVKEIK